MQDSIFRFSLDIHSTQSQVSIPVPQFDTARSIMATLTEGGKPYQLTEDCRAVFTGTKADGNPLFNDCIILNGSVIRYDFTEQTAAVVGLVDCRIKVYGANGKLLTSPRLALLVYDGDDIDYTPSAPEVNALNNIMQVETNRVVAETERVEAEKARAIAEAERVTAENLREQAEQDRKVAFGEMNTDKLEQSLSDLDEKVTDLQEQFDNLDVSVDIPTFDLVALGLPDLVSGGEEVSVETDTTEIKAALEAGAVRFHSKLEYKGVIFDFLMTVHDVVAGVICSGTFEIMGLPIMVTITIEDGLIKGTCLALVREERLEYNMEIPQFDLAYSGLPVVPLDGRQVFAQMDTESIRRALDKGPVRFWVKFRYDGETINAKVTMNAVNVPSDEVYICSGTVDLSGAPMIFNMFVQEVGIMAYFTAVAKAVLPAASINLSGLDTTGQIAETYADGSTKTTSLEFDADGNPIKITDGDGNVTELIW